ncbi:hypothetical protein PsYK624_169660 [Phanerochaete sordida]|uniref:Uncharacterized protein n=1 Tax=Phanerochaete sordida TaxID=48140 RepID=A0A9P3GYC7_9APHY|nr:hypothetical protein PsYK624_169660 [Phanerochaete sordida]
MFRDFLRDHPPLAQSIKRLHLTAFPIGVPESDEDAGQEPLGLLSFQELTLQDVIVISVPSYWEALHAPLPALRRLNVTYLRRTYSQSHVGDILGCFSALDYVRVQNMPSAEEWPDDTAPPGMRVTTFVCLDEQPQVEWLLDYLFDSPSVETLRALHVGAIAAEFPLYRELLDAVRPRLEVFDFTLPVPWDSEAFATEQPEAALPPTSPFSLSGFASLRCLTLRFPMYSGMADADSDHWRPLAKILETCSKCRHLSAIDFLIHDVHKAVTSSSLASILSAVEDSLLGLHASASVEDVHFIVAGAAPFETNVEEQLKEVCPPLIQKVKIRVSRTDLDPKDWVGLDFGIPADGVFMAE